MKNKLTILAVLLMALVLTGCDRRAVLAGMSDPKRHEITQDGVVCYTYSTSISCVKVR